MGEMIFHVNTDSTTYLIWRDTDLKKPARDKLIDAIKRHIEKFGTVPTECLVSQQEFDALAPHETIPLHVSARNYVPRHQFYIGRNTDVRTGATGRGLSGVRDAVPHHDPT